MRLTKKLLTILFAFMVVLAMTGVVMADDSSGSTAEGTKGTITINNAIDGNTYKIYRILELESFYQPSGTGTEGRYAYKVPLKWQQILYLEASAGVKYLIKNSNDYVEWNPLVDKTKVSEFAEKALALAKSISAPIPADYTIVASGTTVSQDNLDLGYYLVDSGVGALCSLSTTNPNVTINEKNDVPTVKKQVKENGTWQDVNTAEFGQEIEFKITITAKPGAENYVLKDKMDDGLELITIDGTNYVNVVDGDSNAVINSTDYTFTKDADNHGFTIAFTETYLKNLRDKLGKKGETGAKELEIIVTYKAKLNDKVNVTSGAENKATLSYGDNKETSDTTTTHSWQLPVFKYYKDGTDNKGLRDATFAIRRKNETNYIELYKESASTARDLVYRVALEGDTQKTTYIHTLDSGNFTIRGLDSAEYELIEIKAPKGYNKLKNPIAITFNEYGIFSVDGVTLPFGETTAKIENKTGTVLPSTGGVGTTMMYIIGAALLVGSGVLLITKKNVK